MIICPYKKVNIFEIGSKYTIRGGGGPRVYTELRPYMYEYILQGVLRLHTSCANDFSSK